MKLLAISCEPHTAQWIETETNALSCVACLIPLRNANKKTNKDDPISAACYADRYDALFLCHRHPPCIKIHKFALSSSDDTESAKRGDGVFNEKKHYSKGKTNILTCATTEVVLCLVLSHDQEFVLGAGEKGTIFSWHVQTGNLMRAIIAAHLGKIASLNICPRNQYIASSGGDGVIKIWYLTDLIRLSVTMKSDANNDVSISMERSTLPIHEFKKLSYHRAQVHKVLFFPSTNSLLAAASADCTVTVADLLSGKCLLREGFHSPVTHLEISQCEKYIALLTSDGKIHLLDIFFDELNAIEQQEDAREVSPWERRKLTLGSSTENRELEPLVEDSLSLVFSQARKKEKLCNTTANARSVNINPVLSRVQNLLLPQTSEKENERILQIAFDENSIYATTSCGRIFTWKITGRLKSQSSVNSIGACSTSRFDVLPNVMLSITDGAPHTHTPNANQFQVGHLKKYPVQDLDSYVIPANLVPSEADEKEYVLPNKDIVSENKESILLNSSAASHSQNEKSEHITFLENTLKLYREECFELVGKAKFLEKALEIRR